MDKPFMTRKEAAEALCVTDQTIDDYRIAGKIRAVKNGKKVLILTEDVRRIQNLLIEAAR